MAAFSLIGQVAHAELTYEPHGAGASSAPEVVVTWDSPDSSDIRASEFIVKKFSEMERLPTRATAWIDQEESGAIRIFGQEGVTTWDGHSMRVFGADTEIGAAGITQSVGPIDGIVYASSLSGLLAFDGEKNVVEVFAAGDEVSDDKPLATVMAVAADEDGKIWMSYAPGPSALGAGISVFDPATRKFAHITVEEHPALAEAMSDVEFVSHHRAFDIEFYEGDVWVAAGVGGVWRYSRSTGALNIYHPSDGSIAGRSAMSLHYHEPSGSLFVGHDKIDSESFRSSPLSVYDPDADRFVSVADAFAQGETTMSPSELWKREIFGFATGKDGLLWQATTLGAVALRSDGKMLHTGTGNLVLVGRQHAAFVAEDGTLWMGGYDGVVSVRRTAFAFTPREEITKGSLLGLDFMPNGDLWATSTSGAALRPAGSSQFSKLSIYPSSNSAILATHGAVSFQGKVVLGSSQGPGIIIVDPEDGSVTPLTDESDHPWAPLSAFTTNVSVDSQGRLWIVSLGGGFKMVEADGVTTHTFFGSPNDESTPFPSSHFSMFEDKDGALWFSGASGISVYEGELDGWRRVRLPTRSGGYRMAYRDGRGAIWIGTSTEGLVIMSPLEGEGGLRIVKELTPEDGLPSGGIISIVEDNDGYVWATTNRGLLRFDSADYSFDLFTRAHGLPSNEFGMGAARQGDQLYFSNVLGMVQVDTSRIGSLSELPPPRIVETVVDRRREAIGGPGPKVIDIPPGDRDLTVRYSAMQFANPEDVVYRYRLSPLDQQWSAWESDTVARWTRLSPGAYTLNVAYKLDKFSTKAGTLSIPVVVPPTFSETLIGRALIGLIILCAVLAISFLVFKYRQRFELERRVEEAVVAERAATDHAKALTRDSHHMAKNSFALSIRFIQRIAKQLRTDDERLVDKTEIISALKSLEDQHYGFAKLQNLLHNPDHIHNVSMQTYFEDVVSHLVETRLPDGHNIEYSVSCGDINAEMRRMRDYGVIVVELVTNALKHAFPRDSVDPRLRVEAKADSRYLTIIVEDNGVGLPEGFDVKSFLNGGLGIIQVILAQELGSLTASRSDGVTRMTVRLLNDA